MKKVSLNRRFKKFAGRHGKALIPSSKTRERKSAFAKIAHSFYPCEEQSKKTTEVNGYTFSAKKAT